MASQTLTPDTGWLQVRREVKPGKFIPYVKIRRTGDIYLSTDFVRTAGIVQCTRAAVYLSTDGYRIGFRFHNDEDTDSFVLAKDGGSNRSSGSDGRVLQARLVKRSAIVAAAAKAASETRYVPRKDVHGVWCIDVVPSFETTLDGSIDRALSGIYRYRRGDDVVYIGRGVIAERMAAPERKEWQFDVIEYSLLNDDKAEAKWEAHWLNEFQAKHHRLPIYNRIGGIKPSP